MSRKSKAQIAEDQSIRVEAMERLSPKHIDYIHRMTYGELCDLRDFVEYMLEQRRFDFEAKRNALVVRLQSLDRDSPEFMRLATKYDQLRDTLN